MLRPSQCRGELKQAMRERILCAIGARGGNRQEPVLYACRLWADYLMELEQLRRFGNIEVTGEEAEGLMLLEAVREQIRQEYIPCPKCGAVSSQLQGACPRGHKLI